MRYRVFGSNDSAVEHAPFLEHLRGLEFNVTVSLRGDDGGWFEANLFLQDEDEYVKLERFLASEEGVRAELHTWIAWVETIETPHQDRLIRQLVGTKQIFTVSPASDLDQHVREVCLAVCRYLARETDGIYQVDGQGFFTRDGDALAPET